MQIALWFLAHLVPPALILRARIATLQQLVITTLGTWASATGATYLYLMLRRDGDPVATLLWFLLIVLPLAAVLPAAAIATRLARPRAQLIPAMGVALFGLLVAVCLMVILAHVRVTDTDELIATAIVVSLPAVYAASGAVFATHLSNRRIN